MKWEATIQVIIISIGLFVGAHFSKIAYQEHEKLGHADLKGHIAMNHGILDISQDSLLPQIDKLSLIKDPMSGWNIHIVVNNFRFAPENASKAHRPGEGHAHLYINGNKIARLYSDWFHIPAFIKDKNEIKVTLNSNDHQTLAIGQEPIEKVVIKEIE